ncbi:Aste57867_8905 [Aphanomyces stellatus]|uniref:Aste57867_8905 protein n=1 Tax=Aphanomyces stellatus TaxID=120398 RepID=A0A485KLV6_9STRA|nr:hypothetical protein As57867_008870 [Aphanomyces stellatus]VFT85789.1 Aste57867_8905 [Aphanomyces stellatus]
MAAPSSFDAVRGTCLDAAWVSQTAAALRTTPPYVDPFGRDPTQAMKRFYPWLRPALTKARYNFTDPRQFPSNTNNNVVEPFSSTCLNATAGETLHGVGETVNMTDGRQIHQGRFQNTLILEWSGWSSHMLTTSVASIILQEVIGYDVSIYKTAGDDGAATERMSSVGKGICKPTIFNAEVWKTSAQAQLDVFANETQNDLNGYMGRSGWFTLVANLNEAWKGQLSTQGNFERPYSADFWQEYTRTNDLVNFYSISKHPNRSDYAKTSECPDGNFGCLNGCAKSDACTVAESRGNTCMLVAMINPSSYPGYLEAVLSNHNIPAYFCHSGQTGVENLVANAIETNNSLTFYHFEPDVFHSNYEGLIVRIALPYTEMQSKSQAQSTLSYGENGYGNPTTNPVTVDFPSETLLEYWANIMSQDSTLTNFAWFFAITDNDMAHMLRTLSAINANSTPPPHHNAPFAAACQWVKANYNIWKNWLSELPSCTFHDFVTYSINANSSNAYRIITFAWTSPDPSDTSLPLVCDGGITALPSTMTTSRSTEWLAANFDVWSHWVHTKPFCDASFYAYMLSDCDDQATRTATFFWLLPQPHDNDMSMECIAGDMSLPQTTSIYCDYVPLTSSMYMIVAGIATVVLAFLVACLAILTIYRDAPVIKRSQGPLLMTMVVGGICFCMYIPLGAGPPTGYRCGLRPVLLVVGYTLVFGSLLVKGLRVYWVFFNKSLKKITVPLAKIAKILLAMLAVDVALLFVWYIVDFPKPKTTIAEAVQFPGQVDHVTCDSSNFLFSMLILFWKALIMLGGMYVSYLVRNAGADFQESIWIFGSTCVVCVCAILLLPLAFIASLPPLASYVTESLLIVVGTVAVMALMLGPKFHRLHEHHKFSRHMTQSTKSDSSSVAASLSAGRLAKASSRTAMSSSSFHVPTQKKMSHLPAKPTA